MEVIPLPGAAPGTWASALPAPTRPSSTPCSTEPWPRAHHSSYVPTRPASRGSAGSLSLSLSLSLWRTGFGGEEAGEVHTRTPRLVIVARALKAAGRTGPRRAMRVYDHIDPSYRPNLGYAAPPPPQTPPTLLRIRPNRKTFMQRRLAPRRCTWAVLDRTERQRGRIRRATNQYGNLGSYMGRALPCRAPHFP